MNQRIRSVICRIWKQKTIITAKRKKNPKNEDSVRRLRDKFDNFKHTNIHIMGMPEGKEREQGMENLFEKIMTEIFPNLVREIGI